MQHRDGDNDDDDDDEDVDYEDEDDDEDEETDDDDAESADDDEDESPLKEPKPRSRFRRNKMPSSNAKVSRWPSRTASQQRLNAAGNESSSDNENGDNDTEKAKDAFRKWKASQSAKELIDETFPVNVDTLFELLFTKSKFYIDFHSSRKTFDIVQSPWQQQSDDGDKKREVKLTLSLTHPMGPKHSPVTEFQTMTSAFTEPAVSYAIDVDTVNSGIPYADSFYVSIHYFLGRVSDDKSRLCVLGGIHYKKTVWGLVKTFIEKNAWSGLEEFFTSISAALQDECRGGASNGDPARQMPMPSRDSEQAPESRTTSSHRRTPSNPPNGIVTPIQRHGKRGESEHLAFIRVC